MNSLKITGSLLLLAASGHLIAEVHVIMTSALIDVDYERRKKEYSRGISTIQSYGFEPWIIEATPITSSFLDEITHQVLYPQTNNPSLRNKGVNETLSIRASRPYLPFGDEDIIIKITGRYWLYDRELIDIIQATSDDYDAYVCFGKHFLLPDQIFTGGYALRWKYLKQIILEMDLEKAEIEFISIEQLFAEFIRAHHLRTKIVDPLNIEARIFFNDFWPINYIRRW